MNNAQQTASPRFRRLLLLGSPGAGKSTLARQLAARTGLPLVHLDRLYWHPGWIESSDSEWTERLKQELGKPAWIMDGNYNRTLPLRLQRAEAAIVLDYPTSLCMVRVCKRILLRGKIERLDLPPECPERFELEFLRYVWRFRRDQRAAWRAALDAFPGEKLILRSPRELPRIDAFLGQ